MRDSMRVQENTRLERIRLERIRLLVCALFVLYEVSNIKIDPELDSRSRFTISPQTRFLPIQGSLLTIQCSSPSEIVTVDNNPTSKIAVTNSID
jgi:hypothetical protein